MQSQAVTSEEYSALFDQCLESYYSPAPKACNNNANCVLAGGCPGCITAKAKRS